MLLTDTQLEVAVTAGDDVTVDSVTVELDSDNSDGFYITYNIGDCQYGVDLIRLGVGSITQQTDDSTVYDVSKRPCFRSSCSPCNQDVIQTHCVIIS